jgi:uncharacterized protein (TIGR02391 family)
MKRNQGGEIIKKFTENQIEAISKVIGDYNSGSEISRLLSQVGIDDENTNTTKWRRVDFWMNQIQNTQNSPANIIKFIQVSLEPSRFYERLEQFNILREKLNAILLLTGLEVNNEGKVIRATKAKNLDEAYSRANQLKQKLIQRSIHSYVLKFCEAEYLQNNYFHAIFEATKSILDRLRDMTGSSEDGVKLVISSFDEKKPALSFNKYQTSSEQNELMGFRSVIIGIVKMVRNTHAHEAKIKWAVDEKDALDILTIVSYIHRRLDETVRTYF